MTTRPPATPPPPALLLAALDAAAEGVVVCAADDTILLVSAAAQALLPGLAPGEGAAGVDRAVREGRLAGRRRPLGDGHYAWYLRAPDDTGDLVPPELPRLDGVELFGSYRAADDALRVGGDFYDVFATAAGGTVVALGDVCGRGAEAAALTGRVRQTLRALCLFGATPVEMLTVLNQTLLQSGRQHRFVTLVVAEVGRTDHGRVRLTVAAGGHPPPLVLRADGTVEEVATAGTLIGAVPETIVRPATVELAPDELCLLYSNGLTEARGGPAGDEQYGESRLAEALRSGRGRPGAAAVRHLGEAVADWVRGGVRDDIAMLAVRAPSRTPLSLRGGGVTTGSPFAIDARRDRRPVRPRSAGPEN